jgi:hypothetical protein
MTTNVPTNTLLEKNAAGVVQPTKYDQQKVRTDLYPVRAKIETDKVFHYGSIVYSVGNWKEGDGFDWHRLIVSAEHHIQDFKLGVNYDPESSLAVLAHANCCIAMALENFLTDHGNDDRHQSQILVDRNEDDAAIAQLMIMPQEVIDRALAKRAKVEADRAKRAGAGPTVPATPVPDNKVGNK